MDEARSSSLLFRLKPEGRGKLDALFAPATWLVGIVAVALRSISLDSETGDYLFCDEGIFFRDVVRMFTQETLSSSEFRSGPMNVYPVYFIVALMELIGDPADSDVLRVGRLALPVVLGGLSAILTAYFARMVTGRASIGILAGGLIGLSPGVVAVSRIWYPDHYIVFFTSLVALISAKVAEGRNLAIYSTAFGAAFALAVSTKYTALFIVLPGVLAYLVHYFRSRSLSEEVPSKASIAGSFLLFVSTATILTAVFHLNSLVRLEEFLADQRFNVENYGGIAEDPIAGIVGYSMLLLFMVFGLGGLVGTVGGVIGLVRYRSIFTALFLLGAPVATVIAMGVQNLFISRNIMSVLPFFATFVAFGFHLIWTAASSRVATRVFRLLLLALAASQVAVLAVNIERELSPDSRDLAEEWLVANISSEKVVGTNEACNGLSVASVAGLSTVEDAYMNQQLDYYVFDSYDDSAIVANFRGENVGTALLHQKYLHWYIFGDKTWFRALLPPFGDDSPLVPEGYTVVKEFSSDGPTVWVLRKKMS
jgi:MFS family permease